MLPRGARSASTFVPRRVPLREFSAEKAERREEKNTGVKKSKGGGRKGERGKRGREKGGFRRAHGKKSVHPVPRDPSRSLSCDSPVSSGRPTDRSSARSCRSARKRSIRERSLSLPLLFLFFLTSLFAHPVLSCACFLCVLSLSLYPSLAVCHSLAYSITGVLCYGIGRVQRRTDCIDASPPCYPSPLAPPNRIAFQTF